MAETSARSKASSPCPAMTDGCARAAGTSVRRAMTDACSRRRTRSGNSVIDVPTSPVVMPGLVPGIHVLGRATKDVDGRDVGAKQIFVASPGHDEPRPGRREISNSPIHAHTSAFSRRGASESCQTTALIERAQGMPGARCTRSLACKMKKHTRSSPQVHRSNPAFPAQWSNGLLRDLPGDRALLSPSSREYGWSAPGRADFASPRRDASVEASGPHDFTVRTSIVRPARLWSLTGWTPPCDHELRADTAAATASRPALVTIAKRPSVGTGRRGHEGVSRRIGSGLFLRE